MDVEENIGSEMRNKGHWVETGHVEITMIWQGLSNIKIKVKSECEIQKDTERTRVRQEEKGNKKVKKKTCQCPTGTGKKSDKTNGPSVTAGWMDACRQARDNLYCIRTLHQPSNITYCNHCTS